MGILGVVLLGGCALFQANRAPIAAFTVRPEFGYEPLTATFDASESADPDRDRLTYTWSFGDGMTASGETATHTYEHAGRYDAILRVTDPDGLDDATMKTIDVRDVPDGYVVLEFDWTWGEEEWRLEFALSWNLYLAYRGRLRTPLVDNYDYGAFVADPLDEPTFEDLADALWTLAGGGPLEFAEMALAFVQGVVSYKADPPDTEWPLYPVETLVDREGDCEDTAILYVSLSRARGVPSQLAFVDTDGDGSPDHVLVLVEVPASFVRPGMTVFELDGTEYALAETSSGPMALGADPWGLTVEDLVELWPF